MKFFEILRVDCMVTSVIFHYSHTNRSAFAILCILVYNGEGSQFFPLLIKNLFVQ